MAASMTGKCSLVADIGSDHAYLPVSLILSGNALRAIVTDLRQGPLENSRRTAQKYGLVEKMSFSRGSGFGALDGYERPDVITVCGMGGELIKSFIGERPDIARGSVLVLQPMNNAGMLEKYLRQQGYSVTDQAISTDGIHYYRCMRALYTGEREDDPDACDCEFPPCLIEKRDPVMYSYLQKRLDTAERILCSMERGAAADTSVVGETRKLVNILKERIGRYDS